MKGPCRTLSVALLCCACGMGGTPDPRTVEGTMAYAAMALERDDPRMLFRVVDERARHAMISIVADRRQAAARIRETYPEGLREEALAELGDAASVEDAAGLFVRRCDASCRQAIAASVGAPVETTPDGDELVVRTSRGATLRLYRPREGAWWGIVWRTAELDRERDRANQALQQIERNAETYRRRRELAREAMTASSPEPPVD